MMNKKLIALAVTPLLLSGCFGGLNYKGVQVFIQQESGGSSYADPMRVPEHQQGSDVLVPILEQYTDILDIETEGYLDALKECRKLIEDGADVDCGEIKQPTRPQIPTSPVDPAPAPTPDNPPVTAPDVPTPNASWSGGNLWKPVADSRGGVPVFLTRADAPRCGKVRLFNDTDEIPVAIEYRGRTNGNRETYFLLDKSDDSLPKNLIVDACSQVFLVADPTQRYE